MSTLTTNLQIFAFIYLKSKYKNIIQLFISFLIYLVLTENSNTLVLNEEVIAVEEKDNKNLGLGLSLFIGSLFIFYFYLYLNGKGPDLPPNLNLENILACFSEGHEYDRIELAPISSISLERRFEELVVGMAQIQLNRPDLLVNAEEKEKILRAIYDSCREDPELHKIYLDVLYEISKTM
jgi:hypothetical protein